MATAGKKPTLNIRGQPMKNDRTDNRFDPRTRGRYKVEFTQPSLTKQSFKDECDINVIMSKYIKYGVLPQGISNATYGDFSASLDYMEAQNIILEAKTQFDTMPSKVRDRFANDPVRFLEFVNNRENLAEAQQLGLLKDVPPPKEKNPQEGTGEKA